MAKVKITNTSGVLKAFPTKGGERVMLADGESDSLELREGWLTEDMFRTLTSQRVQVDLPKGHDIADFAKQEAADRKAAEEKMAKTKANAEKAKAERREALEKEAKDLGVEFGDNHTENDLRKMIENKKLEDHLRSVAVEREIEGADKMSLKELQKVLPDEKLPA